MATALLSSDEGGIKATMDASHEPFDPELERTIRKDLTSTVPRKKALFLARNVFETQGMGKSHFLKLNDLSLDEIVAKLKARTIPQTIEIAERFRFFFLNGNKERVRE